jgi:hypothetical protein
MKRIFTLKLNHMLKKSLTCATMLAVVAIAIASSGGGKNKPASSNNLGIIPVSARGAFTLKSKPSYSGSHLLSTMNLKNSTVYRSVITYQKGNTIFIVPSKYRVSNSKLSFNSGPALRSNLNMLDLRLKLCR